MSRLKQSLKSKILEIPGVTVQSYEGRNGEFAAFSFKEKEFAHFHTGNELDLRLTKKTIAGEQLKHPEGSENHPNRSKNSPWIELRFTVASDIQKIVKLVVLATGKIT